MESIVGSSSTKPRHLPTTILVGRHAATGDTGSGNRLSVAAEVDVKLKNGWLAWKGPNHSARRSRLQTALVARHADRRHAGSDRILAGEEARATCGARVLRVLLGESDPFQADSIDIRRRIAHRPEAVPFS